MNHPQVENMPPELHDKLRHRAVSEGMTMSGYVIQLLQRDLALPSQREWLDVVLSQEPSGVSTEEILEAIHSARAERDREIATAARGG